MVLLKSVSSILIKTIGKSTNSSLLGSVVAARASAYHAFKSPVVEEEARKPRKLKSFDESLPQYQGFNPESPVCAWNEWDQLEEVVVGVPDYTCVPQPRVEVMSTLNPAESVMHKEFGGKYWKDMVGPDEWQKVYENLEELVKAMEGEGVKVVRPDIVDHGREFETPYYKSTGFYGAMPRDYLMVVGDEIIEAAMSWRARYFEFIAYRTLVKDYWARGAKWSAGPKPVNNGNLIDESYDLSKIESYAGYKYVTTEYEPCFDTADFSRCGKDIFGARSHTTNKAGIEWLRRHLAPRGIRVHELNVTDPYMMHVDATFYPLKPGVYLKHPAYTCKQIPLIEKSDWKVYDFPTPNAPANELHLGLPWLAMNLCMINPNLALVEKTEDNLANFLERFGVKAVRVNMKNAFPMGGGFHCWTCDIRRKGDLQEYF